MVVLSEFLYLSLFFFFFSSRRRHTRWNCDWSSDVCSSDLRRTRIAGAHARGPTAERLPRTCRGGRRCLRRAAGAPLAAGRGLRGRAGGGGPQPGRGVAGRPRCRRARCPRHSTQAGQQGTPMTYATIKLERDGVLATLTLNRPDKMNSLNDQLLADFRAA